MSTAAFMEGPSPTGLTLATVRHRVKVTNGSGSRTAGIALAFKLAGPRKPDFSSVDQREPEGLGQAGRFGQPALR